MKSKWLFAAALTTLAACAANAENPKYEIDATLPDMDGEMVYILNYDTSEVADSAIVANGHAVFTNTVDKPFMGRMVAEGERLGSLIVEPGKITVVEGKAADSPLNKTLEDFAEFNNNLGRQYQANPSDSLYAELVGKLSAYTDSLFKANADNPIGYYLFLQQTYDMDRDQLNAALKEYPQMAQYKRIQKAVETFDRIEATSPGKKFTDFSIDYDGVTYKLSDYVGKGQYTLVDFWASWCGPCRREAETLKKIYAEYAPKGLEIVGIAVWDEPDNTVAAIEELQLPWKQVINGQTIPTDIYGILGIPCIILFAPDGTIVSRGLQGEALVGAVANAMATTEN